MADRKIYPARAGYLSAEAVEKYARRSRRRNAAEARLLDRLLEDAPPPGKVRPTALDAPCGAGRLAADLKEKGWEVTVLDISTAMLLRGRGDGRTAAAVAGEMERLPFREGAFDLVVCWRFFHHLPTRGLRVAVLAELARVSRGWVILSFFHPLSLHNAARRLRGMFSGRKGNRFPCSRAFLAREARGLGLLPRRWIAQGPCLRDLGAVLFEKVEGRPPRAPRGPREGNGRPPPSGDGS